MSLFISLPRPPGRPASLPTTTTSNLLAFSSSLRLNPFFKNPTFLWFEISCGFLHVRYNVLQVCHYHPYSLTFSGNFPIRKLARKPDCFLISPRFSFPLRSFFLDPIIKKIPLSFLFLFCSLVLSFFATQIDRYLLFINLIKTFAHSLLFTRQFWILYL